MESTKYSMQSEEQEGMTLRELILTIKEYTAEITKQWWVIGLFCLPFFAWKGYVYKTSHTIYPAKITFMIDDGNVGGLNIGGLLSSLGGGDVDKNYDKIVALSKSMRIVQDVILTKTTINGTYDFLGNHIIRVENINEEYWANLKVKPGIPSLKGFLFTRDSFDNFTRTEYSAMKFMQSILNGDEKVKGIFSAGYDEDTGIITYKVACRTEELSIALLNTFYEKLSSFYIEKKIGKNIATFNLVKQKADSIRKVLNLIERNQASFEDASHSVLLNVDKVPAQRFSRDKQLLTLMYAESAKNLELADFALKSSTPYIQLIDKALPPLVPLPVSRLRLLLTAILFGFISGVVFIICKKLIVESTS